MQIRILRDGAFVNRKSRSAGDVLSVDKPDGVSLVANGIAERVHATATAPPETAAAEPAETAAATPKRRRRRAQSATAPPAEPAGE